jgi:hypothetical protein
VEDNALVSKATVVLRDRLPAEATAQWWRMAFNTTEEVEMVADDPDAPTVVTWTFPDGLDEHITPSSVRHRQPTTRLPEGGIAAWTGQRNHAPCRFVAGVLRRAHGRPADQLTAMAGIN